MIKELNKCEICPHRCKVNRNNNQVGRCKSSGKVKIALYNTHNFEEPCISGKNGSGTVFFSNCNLNCIYCQNYEISQLGKGVEYSVEELAEIFLKQEHGGAENINLVTPTSYAYQIKEAIKISKQKGLNIPIIYNTNGYENIETIKALDGYIDVYLPDLKYAENSLARKYSRVEDYFETATKAIKEMVNQVGVPKFSEYGMIEKGVIIRHLVLPNCIENSKKVLSWIKDNIPQDVYISVMAQYFPTYKAQDDKMIGRKLTPEEWKEIENYVYDIGIEKGFIQELGEHEEEYVPKF